MDQIQIAISGLQSGFRQIEVSPAEFRHLI